MANDICMHGNHDMCGITKTWLLKTQFVQLISNKCYTTLLPLIRVQNTTIAFN